MLEIGELSDPVVGAIKAAMKCLGVKLSSTVRGPALPPPSEDYAKLDGVLSGAGLQVTGV